MYCDVDGVAKLLSRHVHHSESCRAKYHKPHTSHEPHKPWRLNGRILSLSLSLSRAVIIERRSANCDNEVWFFTSPFELCTLHA